MNETAASYLRESLAMPPFHQWLRPEPRDVAAENRRLVIGLPMRREFWRDPRRPEIHGRVIAAVIDVAGHAAIAAKLRHGVPTIDLRTDYLRMPAGKEPYATAEPVNLGIVDVRITAKQSKLVATSRGLFSTRAG
ncbi:MAG TPA: PaaI family thioesterase [Mesorhizobium sp.]|nr:PaaI family thioesterase [Mesorhizobium sp.]